MPTSMSAIDQLSPAGETPEELEERLVREAANPEGRERIGKALASTNPNGPQKPLPMPATRAQLLSRRDGGAVSADEHQKLKNAHTVLEERVEALEKKIARLGQKPRASLPRRRKATSLAQKRR